MPRVLLTGFEPFDKSSMNPSQVIVERIAESGIPDVDLQCVVLPVEFRRAGELLLQHIDSFAPQIVIALGQAEGRSQVTPERVAVNLDDARIPDNGGVRLLDEPIDPEGPAAYFTTLPVKAIVEDLNAAGIPASVSLSAGAFVCNHVFYVMQQALHATDVQSGFIHVPLMAEQSPEFPGLPTMDIEDMIRAVAFAVRRAVSTLAA